jgi:hypothetical protein
MRNNIKIFDKPTKPTQTNLKHTKQFNIIRYNAVEHNFLFNIVTLIEPYKHRNVNTIKT